MLTKETREQLAAELQHLQAALAKIDERRVVVERKVAALQLILSSDEDVETEKPTGGQPAVGLRELIRRILEQYSGGLRPIHIAARVEAAGYKPTGSMTTAQLVSSEVHRMHALGKLQRVRGARYRLRPSVVAPTPEPAPTSAPRHEAALMA
jgi:hypothetical protein